MLARIHREEVAGRPAVIELLRVFEHEMFLVLLDSATPARAQDSRYSILTADPVHTCVLSHCDYQAQPFTKMRQWQTRLPQEDSPGLPPFCGGIAGLMSYDLGHAFEQLPRVPAASFETPVLIAGLFDWALVWDHLDETVSLYVLRLDGDDRDAVTRQQARLLWFRDQIARSAGKWRSAEASFAPVPGETSASFSSTTTEQDYLRSVQRVIDYIAAGDIFQANLSQQLTADWPGSAVELYGRLRRENAAPFCGLLQTPGFSVISASPERFLKVRQGRHVETRPIKGTRRRQQSPIADLYTGEELLASEKDRAENVMIVDLLRNDLSRVCRTGTVQVTGLCEIEVFETVQHLVSTVIGELRDECDLWDLCAACFPGGSITGAPKIRAMEIIAELEQVSRGAYCGSLFYCGPQADFDSSILIRTFTLKRGRLSFPAGGGIVADSDPQGEYDETLHKASGMLRSLRRTPP